MNSQTHEFVVSTWQRLGEPPVGKNELRRIQRLMAQQPDAAGESPAAIARILADAGAELRHSEIIEFDAQWRSARIELNSRKFRGLEKAIAHDPLTFKDAEALIIKLEGLRLTFERDGDREALAVLTALAADSRRAAESIANNRAADNHQRLEQAEIAEWLKVWLQTPNLFANWIDLRKRSAEYRRRFGDQGS